MTTQAAYIVTDNRNRPRKPLDQLKAFRDAVAFRAIQAAQKSEAAEGKLVNVQDIPLSLVNTDPERFQNRKEEFSSESVERIIQAVKEGSFKWEMLDPIILWISPEDGKLYVLSGHSRTEAFKRLAADGITYQGKSFESIPAKIVEASESEAVEIAHSSNVLSTRETELERAAYYRNLRNNGRPMREIMDEARRHEARNANKIVALSFLNPIGRVMGALELTSESDVTGRSRLMTMAVWIGNSRRQFPQLTDLHEGELFEWLFYKDGYGNKSGQVNSQDKFMELVARAVERNTEFGKFQEEKPLNIQRVQTLSPYEIEHRKRLAELESEVKEARKNRDDKHRRLVSRGASQEEISKIMRQYDEAYRAAELSLAEERGRADQVADASRRQLSLFGLGTVVNTTPHVEALRSLVKVQSKTIMEMIRAGVPLDEALKFTKKWSALDNRNWERVVEAVTKELQFFGPSKISLNGPQVLAQNSAGLDLSGFVPNYQILPAYDHLISNSANTDEYMGNLSLGEVLLHIQKLTKEGQPQVKNLAKHLYSSDPGQAACNVWHFIKVNIKYAFDKENREELRLPAKTWADRRTGVDCDCYAIFGAAILCCMGYKPVFETVRFEGQEGFGHIYLILGDYIIDPVMNKFNRRPAKIKEIMHTHVLRGTFDFAQGPMAETVRNFQAQKESQQASGSAGQASAGDGGSAAGQVAGNVFGAVSVVGANVPGKAGAAMQIIGGLGSFIMGIVNLFKKPGLDKEKFRQEFGQIPELVRDIVAGVNSPSFDLPTFNIVRVALQELSKEMEDKRQLLAQEFSISVEQNQEIRKSIDAGFNQLNGAFSRKSSEWMENVGKFRFYFHRVLSGNEADFQSLVTLYKAIYAWVKRNNLESYGVSNLLLVDDGRNLTDVKMRGEIPLSPIDPRVNDLFQRVSNAALTQWNNGQPIFSTPGSGTQPGGGTQPGTTDSGSAGSGEQIPGPQKAGGTALKVLGVAAGLGIAASLLNR